ncbi:MAG: hypothetical protein ACJ740_16460 [Gaiellales bacterium]|jgi:hypothetical protein
MTRIFNTLHRAALLAAAMICVAATSAVAATTPPDRADGLNGAHPALHASTVGVPDRTDRIGTATATVVPAVGAPDRADGLGSARFPTATAPTVIIRTPAPDAGFDWLDAGIGAMATLGVAALAAAGVGVRSRRQVALPS